MGRKEDNDLGILNSCYDGIPTIDMHDVRGQLPSPPGQWCSNCLHHEDGKCTADPLDVWEPPIDHWCDDWERE